MYNLLDEAQLERMLGSPIPKCVEKPYKRMQKIWHRVANGPLEISMLMNVAFTSGAPLSPEEAKPIVKDERTEEEIKWQDVPVGTPLEVMFNDESRQAEFFGPGRMRNDEWHIKVTLPNDDKIYRLVPVDSVRVLESV